MNAPLSNRTIAVTRAREPSGALETQLAALGARVLQCPLIRVEPLADLSELDAALDRLEAYDWVIFTSVNAVEIVGTRLGGRTVPPGGRPAIAAVGPATVGALSRIGLTAAAVPGEALGDALGELLVGRGVRGKRVLFPRARIAREALPRMLADAGAEVDRVTVYETLPDVEGTAVLLAELRAGTLDAVTLASGSAAEGFQAAAGAQPRGPCRLISIGPATTARAAELGLAIDRTASEHTVDGLVRAVVEELAGR